MNRARWTTALATFITLWLVGALVLASTMQRRLETAAQAALAAYDGEKRRLGGVTVTFEGQHALLAGQVRSEHDRAKAQAIVSELIRVPIPWSMGLAAPLNPVDSVTNTIEVKPLAPGWLMLATRGTEAELLGTTATEYEARDLARGIQDVWSLRGGRVQGMPKVDEDRHDEAALVATTLRDLPLPSPTPALHAARLGGIWRPLPLGDSDESLRSQTAVLGVTDEEWGQVVLPALQAVRNARDVQQESLAQQRRLAALSPAYLFIATRDGEVTLRGEVGTAKDKASLLDEALVIFAPLRLRDEIRVTAKRRPGDEFAPLTTALLPKSSENGARKARSLWLGLAGAAWQTVDFQAGAEAAPWKEHLPASASPADLATDGTAVVEWLQVPAPSPAAPAQRPAMVALTCFEGRVVLTGQVAEQATRSQFIAAVRHAYGPATLVQHENLQVMASCGSFSGLLEVLKSLPPAPASHNEALFALVIPGEGWKVLPITHDLLEAGGFLRSGQFASASAATFAESQSQPALELLRAWHQRNHPSPASR